MGYTDQFGNALPEGTALEDQLSNQGGNYTDAQMIASGIGVLDSIIPGAAADLTPSALSGLTDQFGNDLAGGTTLEDKLSGQNGSYTAAQMVGASGDVDPAKQARTGESGKESTLSDTLKTMWTTINAKGNEMGVKLGADMIAGMFAQKYKAKAAEANMKMANASMMNAQTNQGQLALEQQKLANGSSIAGTNFGTSAGNGLLFSDKLAQRRARNGAPSL